MVALWSTLSTGITLHILLVLFSIGLLNADSTLIFDISSDLSKQGKTTGLFPVQGSGEGSSALEFSEHTANRRVEVTRPNLFGIKQAVQEYTNFTFLVTIKLKSGSNGYLLAFADGHRRLLEIRIIAKRRELRFHYMTDFGGQQIFTERLPYDLDDNQWHRVALSVTNRRQLSLHVDCQRIYSRLLKHSTPKLLLFRPTVKLWIGQSEDRNFFIGVMEDIKLVFGGNGVLLQCPPVRSKAFDSEIHTLISSLQRTITDLQVKVLSAESKIANLERCECNVGCQMNNVTYKRGQTWAVGPCKNCSCSNTGALECSETTCPTLQCSNSIRAPGTCCRKCPRDCRYQKKNYKHAEKFGKGCWRCTCSDGHVDCKITTCKKANCSKKYQVMDPDECCVVCMNPCEEPNICKPLAICTKTVDSYNCTCPTGYHDNGPQCVDIDECSTQKPCQASQTCVNTPGSYRCECQQGTQMNKEGLCVDIDECTLGTHNCSAHAVCINEYSSFRCSCEVGYLGDGYVCKGFDFCADSNNCHANAVCTNNEGFFYTCTCLPGFHGDGSSSCEDVDECRTGLHACSAVENCVNTLGSYRCDCKEGYFKDNMGQCTAKCDPACQNGGECIAPNVCKCSYGFRGKWCDIAVCKQVCQNKGECIGRDVCRCQNGFRGTSCELDVDECSLNTHRCQPHSECVNLPGRYYCRCRPGYSDNGVEDNQWGSKCVDINECSGVRGVNYTCHFSQQCLNMEGSYRCICQVSTGSKCTSSCFVMQSGHSGRLVDDGAIVQGFASCQRCVCKGGRVECNPLPCDCSSATVDTSCCPHCSTKTCPVGLSGTAKSGTSWLKDCNVCNCLDGLTLCQSIQCPVTRCTKPVLREGHCCKECLQTIKCPGLFGLRRVGSGSGRSCFHNNKVYRDGHRWVHAKDPCIQCECQNGHICCAKYEHCPVDSPDLTMVKWSV